MDVLFLCVANSARSQMAEGLARAIAPPGVRVWSAGSRPARLNPVAVEVMAELGIDIRAQRSKGIGDVPIAQIDRVVTLCAEEVCPVLPGKAVHEHWPLPDPVAVDGDAAGQRAAFRAIRDELQRRLRTWFEELA